MTSMTSEIFFEKKNVILCNLFCVWSLKICKFPLACNKSHQSYLGECWLYKYHFFSIWNAFSGQYFSKYESKDPRNLENCKFCIFLLNFIFPLQTFNILTLKLNLTVFVNENTHLGYVFLKKVLYRLNVSLAVNESGAITVKLFKLFFYFNKSLKNNKFWISRSIFPAIKRNFSCDNF